MRLNNLSTFLYAGVLHAGGLSTNMNAINPPFIDTAGDTVSSYYLSSSSKGLLLGDNLTSLIIGSGTTPVTASDYTLASLIDETGITSSYTRMSGVTDGKAYLTVTRHIQNTTASDITFSEIGFTAYVWKGNSLSCRVLLAREVLPEPITIAVGDTVAISMTIEI